MGLHPLERQEPQIPQEARTVIKGDLHKLQVEKIRRYLKSNGVPDGLDLTYNGKVLRDDMIGEDFGLVPNAVLKLVAGGGGGGGGGGGSSQLQQRGASPASKQQGGSSNSYNNNYGASDSRSGSLGNTPNNNNWSTRYRSGSQQQQQYQRSNSGGGGNPTTFSSLRSGGGGGGQDTFGAGAGGGGLSSSPQNFQRLPSRATEIEDRFKELQAVHSDFTQNTTNTASGAATRGMDGSPFSQQQQQQNPSGYYDPLAHERHLRMQRMTGGGMGFVASSISPSEAPSGITYSSANVSMTSHQYPHSLGGSPAKQPPSSTSGNTNTNANINTHNSFGGGPHFAGLISGALGGGGGVGAGVAGEGAGASSSASASRLASLEAENERLRREVDSLKLDLTRKRQEHPPSDDMLINAKANLLELSKDLGIHLAFDQNLTCVIGNEERNTVLITFDAATERLYLYSTILTSLPSNEAVRLKLFELLLDGAMLGRDMAGGGIGISMQNNIAMMCTSFSLRNASQYALRDITPAFLEALQRWRSAAGDLILSAT